MIAPEAASFTTLESRMVSFLWDGKTQPSVRLCIGWAARLLNRPAQTEAPTLLEEINGLELYVRPLPFPPSKAGYLWRAATHGIISSSSHRRAVHGVGHLQICRSPGGTDNSICISSTIPLHLQAQHQPQEEQTQLRWHHLTGPTPDKTQG